jgi:predicted transcriptional regulator
MPMTVLLSVKPQFAEAILDGTKKFEFRRALFRDPNVRRVVLYASSPVQRVVGEFTIQGIVSMDLESLWEHTESDAGIQKDYFDEYFAGRDSGYAVAVGVTRRYPEPLALEQHFGIQHPPQSFRYLRDLAPDRVAVLA